MNEFISNPNTGMDYFPDSRNYLIKIFEDSLNTHAGVYQNIYYCPWCGKKLPPSLSDQWYEEITKLGIKEPDDTPELIPEEFKTEEWWKKRKL